MDNNKKDNEIVDNEIATGEEINEENLNEVTGGTKSWKNKTAGIKVKMGHPIN